jgi:hypothetical protein
MMSSRVSHELTHSDEESPYEMAPTIPWDDGTIDPRLLEGGNASSTQAEGLTSAAPPTHSFTYIAPLDSSSYHGNTGGYYSGNLDNTSQYPVDLGDYSALDGSQYNPNYYAVNGNNDYSAEVEVAQSGYAQHS